MFMKLLNRLLGRYTDSAGSSAEVLVHSLTGNLPEDRIRENEMLVIFQQGRLVNFYREDPPADRHSGESWWLVPEGDLELEIQIESEEDIYSIDVSVRFEAEADLWSLLEAHEDLTREDLVSLVTSKLAGVIEMFADSEHGSLPDSNAGKQEQLRARLSLILQNHGLRCTAVRDWQLISLEPSISSTAPAETTSSDDDLAEAIQQVDQADHWNHLVSTLEASGCQFDAQEATALDDLGQQVIADQVTSQQASRRLQELIAQARRQAGIPQPELQRWRGLEMRIPDDLNADAVQDNEVVSETPGPLLTGKHRPGTWWLLSYRSVDDRLLPFLRKTLGHLRTEFDVYRSNQSQQEVLVSLRQIDQRLGIALDLTETVPTLRPRQSSLKPTRQELKSLVRHLEAAVTAVETTQAAITVLGTQAAGDDRWDESCSAVCAALDHLINHLQQRRQVHTSVET
jgi:hypothetical protein